MNDNFMRISIIVILALVGAGIGHSQEEALVLTVEEAVRLALRNNVGLDVQRKAIEKADRTVSRTMGESFLPKFDFDSRYTRVDSDSVDRANASMQFAELIESYLPSAGDMETEPFLYRGTYVHEFSFSQPIYNADSIAGFRIVRASNSIERYKLSDRELDVRRETKRFFYELAKAVEREKIILEQIETTRKRVASVNLKVEVGLRHRTDALQWEVRLASDEAALVAAGNGIDLSRASLNEILGRRLDAPLDVQAETVPAQEIVMESALTATTAALSDNHPRLKIAKTAVDMAIEEVRAAKAGFFPRVNMAGHYGWREDDDWQFDDYNKWDLSLMVTVPVFRYETLQGYWEARSGAGSVSKMYEDARRKLDLGLYQARSRVSLIVKELELLRKTVDLAKENMELLTNRYNQGLAQNLDVVDAQTAYSNARVSLSNRYYDFLIALSEIESFSSTSVRE